METKFPDHFLVACLAFYGFFLGWSLSRCLPQRSRLLSLTVLRQSLPLHWRDKRWMNNDAKLTFINVKMIFYSTFEASQPNFAHWLGQRITLKSKQTAERSRLLNSSSLTKNYQLYPINTSVKLSGNINS